MGQLIQYWLICGPFPLEDYSEGTPDFEHIPGFETDYLAEHGGESKSDIKEGQIETFKGESFKWFKERNITETVLMVYDFNKTAFNLFKKYGFKTESYIMKKNI